MGTMKFFDEYNYPSKYHAVKRKIDYYDTEKNIEIKDHTSENGVNFELFHMDHF